MEQWIASLRDSRASLTARPVAEREPMTADGSGLQSRTAFAWFDRGLLSWRTSPACDLLGEWLPYSQTWPRSGSVSNGTAFERQTWAPAISVSGCSSWPTTTSTDAKSSSGINPAWNHGTTLTDAARHWPTPASRDAKGENSIEHMTSRGGASHAHRPTAELCDVPFFAPGPVDERWANIIQSRPELAPATAKPEFCRVADGLASGVVDSRADRLRCVGNGVVALQAAVAVVQLGRRLGLRG